jgi:peptide/nickel transport system substrate-binding protein
MARTGPRLHRFSRVVVSLSLVGVIFGAASATATARVSGRAVPNAKYGGSYSFRLTDPPDCLDPQKTGATSSTFVDGYVFDSLLSIDQHGRYVGNLATSYKVADHGLRLTFKLRHGVRFSNGDRFTASAVKYTFDRAVNPATKSPAAGPDLAAIADTKVLGPYTVQLDLKTPSRPLLTNLTDAFTGILDPKATKKQGANTCQKPVGTGPYKIQSTGPAFSDVRLVSNKYRNFAPAWEHHQGPPYIPTLQLQTIADDSTAISNLLTGALSLAGIPGTQLGRVKGNKNIKLHSAPSSNLIFFSFNTAHKPFNNVNVRRAVASLINRKAIVKAALGGLGKAEYGPLAPAIPYFDKSAGNFMPKYDISAARKVIKTYHAEGPYSLLLIPAPEFSTTAEIIQAAAAQAGMKINLDSVGSVGAYIAAASAGNFDMNLLSYGFNDPDILYLFLHSSQETAGGLNFTHFHDKTLDGLLTEGRTTLNSKKVAKIYDQVQVRVNKEALFLGLAAPTIITGVRSNIKGYHTNSAGGYAVQDLYIK